jgi:hypothetical protein
MLVANQSETGRQDDENGSMVNIKNISVSGEVRQQPCNEE